MTARHPAHATIEEHLFAPGSDPNVQILNLDGTLVIVRTPGRWVDRSNAETAMTTTGAPSEDHVSLT